MAINGKSSCNTKNRVIKHNALVPLHILIKISLNKYIKKVWLLAWSKKNQMKKQRWIHIYQFRFQIYCVYSKTTEFVYPFHKTQLIFYKSKQTELMPTWKFVDWIISHLPLQSCNFFACLVPSQGKVCLNCSYRCVYYKYLSDVFRFEPTNFWL